MDAALGMCIAYLLALGLFASCGVAKPVFAGFDAPRPL